MVSVCPAGTFSTAGAACIGTLTPSSPFFGVYAVRKFDRADTPACPPPPPVPTRLHSVQRWVLQRRPVQRVLAVPEQQHERFERCHVRLRRRLFAVRIRRQPRLHQYALQPRQDRCRAEGTCDRG